MNIEEDKTTFKAICDIEIDCMKIYKGEEFELKDCDNTDFWIESKHRMLQVPISHFQFFKEVER